MELTWCLRKKKKLSGMDRGTPDTDAGILAIEKEAEGLLDGLLKVGAKS